jgi:hypothetical protein
MRSLLLLLLAGFTAGCGIKTMLPRNPVWTDSQREQALGKPQSAPVTYTDSGSGFPILPFQIFGIGYDLDLVVVADTGWDMHEYARVPLGEGEYVWVVKEARLDGSQYILVDYPDPVSFAPELQFPIREEPLRVTDRSTEDILDITFEYRNWDNEPVRMRYQGKPPQPNQSRRNGSTMHHSEGLALVVLDLAGQRFGSDLEMEIAGRAHKPRRILGVQKYLVALEQVQGGLIRGRFDIVPHESEFPAGFSQHRGDAETRWILRREGETLVAETSGAITTLRYVFEIREGTSGRSYEFRSATVEQKGRHDPTFHIEVNPALPDLSRAWKGETLSRFVLDVNGQRSHGVGHIRASSTENGAHVHVEGEKPWWVKARPFRTHVAPRQDGGFAIHSERAPLR